ncbi:hypothetical protein ACFQH3_15245 [Haladaptatus sp. GCM10025707]|uniref:DUF7504 family protein n=1 Tax=unclassified Haladaptatus TaxID=2622732 RepID=UPI0023E870E3|nr:recombinase RecA [Haladaptatus sp. QDMS2]
MRDSERGDGADSRTSESLLRADAVTEGTNVLIAGPAMTEKRRLALSLVGGADDNGALFITTSKNATQIRREFEAVTGGSGDALRVVDCVGGDQQFGRESDDRRTSYVSSAADMTGIGIAATGMMQQLYRDDSVEDVRVGLSSLSTILMFADLKRLYQFTHVLTGRIESVGFRGVFTLDSTAADEETLNILKQLFDVYVETRDTDDGLELRVRGDDIGPREWTPY